MLTEFEDTEVGLIVNRLKGGISARSAAKRLNRMASRTPVFCCKDEMTPSNSTTGMIVALAILGTSHSQAHDQDTGGSELWTKEHT